MELLEREILNKGKVLGGGVLKVGSFLNQNIDVKLLMEMFDVVACVNTMSMQLKYHYPECFTEQRWEEAEEAVITKNMARGYYAPEV